MQTTIICVYPCCFDVLTNANTNIFKTHTQAHTQTSFTKQNKSLLNVCSGVGWNANYVVLVF
jgi:hypothetical protein